ncbi:MAG: hypothetical protein ISR65_18820 [Bacteriovoracaceae bacterium]|nr:hypothetical protein [Bacteriovoracaceae bacterium]
MSKMILFFLLFSLPILAQETKSSPVKKPLEKKTEIQKSQPDSNGGNHNYFSFSRSQKQNKATTVTAGYEVDFDDSVFHQFQFQKRYKKLAVKLGMDLSEDASKIIRYSGMLGFDDYILSVEQSKLSGKITYKPVTQSIARVTKTSFKDNEYLDIKFFRPFGYKGHGGFYGFMYYAYDRPTVVKVNDVIYYDPKATTRHYAMFFSVDTLRRMLVEGDPIPSFDWYFTALTSFGLGKVSLSSQTKSENDILAKPSDNSYSGVGGVGEYELGIYYSMTKYGYTGIIKVGYNVQLEAPLMLNSNTVSRDDVYPDESLVNHGLNLTLAMSF